MGIKRCPKCGSVKLLARKITGVQVESLENGEFDIKAEGKKYQIEIIGCAHCKAEFEESDLVEMVQCKKCGKYTELSNLDANGECDVCCALEERPDLANMSKEDLIRMMLKLEKSTVNNTDVKQPTQATQSVPVATEDANTEVSPVAQEKMKAAQAAIQNASNDFSKGIIEETKEEVKETEQNPMNPPETPENNTEEEKIEKPKRGRRPRKKTDVENQEENNDAENPNEVTKEQAQDSAEEMANLQEAPFPEQDTQMQEMFNENNTPQKQSEQTTQPSSDMGFQMFDNEQSF